MDDRTRADRSAAWRLLGGLLTMLTCVAAASPVGPTRVAGVEFAERARIGAGETMVDLELCGAGLFRYRVVFKGYAAAFYHEDCSALSGPGTDAARRLEISYFWPIPGEKFGEAAERLLARSLSERELASLADRLDRLHESYRSVEPGDRYTLTFVPGRGTQLALNGLVLQTIEGADFAEAYFGIWLGDSPLSRDLKAALLERATGS